jgi:GAF domain-containing protein/anti-sigma regulatory factor (Ser/Thr protein kinase)
VGRVTRTRSGPDEPLGRAEVDLARVRVDLAARVADDAGPREVRASLSSRVTPAQPESRVTPAQPESRVTPAQPESRVTPAQPEPRVQGALDVQAILDEILRAVVTLLRAESGVIMLHDAASDELCTQASVGFSPDYLRLVERVPRGAGACGVALDTLQPVVVHDVARDPIFAAYRDAAAVAGYRSAYSNPLVTLGGEVMGTIAAYFPRPHVPTDAEQHLVDSYARQAGELIARARLYDEAHEFAARERRRSEQLRALAGAALALTATRSVERLVKTVTELARSIVGTHQAVTSRLWDGWTEATTFVSLSEKYAAWRDFDAVPQGLGVLNVVTRENRPLRLRGDDLVAHPEWRGLRDAPDHPPLPDYLGAPLVGRDGRNLGLIQLSDKVDGTSFTADDEAMLVQLAQMASAAIENAELIARERAARVSAETGEHLQRLLSDASHAFAASLELDETLSAVTRLTVPALADWCGVFLAHEDGRVVLADDAATSDRLRDALRGVDARYPSGLGRPYGVRAVMRSGRSELYATIDEDLLEALATPAVSADELRALGVRSALVVPLPARGHTTGALAFARVAGEPYTGAELDFAEELGRRAALAIDNARRYHAERLAVARLQRSLLPQALPLASGLTAASRYLPGASGMDVGGDWYDLIELGDGRLGVVVGDVMGRGIEAAAVMGQLRASVRAYAIEGHAPPALLDRLDRVVGSLGDGQLVTCLYGILEPDTGELTIGAAGHLPPLVVADGAARYLPVDPGLPLGVGGATYRASRVQLPAGATLLLYTDGLVEGRDCPIDDGMERLRTAAAAAPGRPDELCDTVLRALGRDGEHDDDTALLAVTLSAGALGSGVAVTLELAAVAGSIAQARAFVADAVAGSGVDVDTAVLLVSELATNALRHGLGRVTVRVGLDAERVVVDVHDEHPECPHRRATVLDQDEGGRGMLLVDALAEAWGCEPAPPGKRVWFALVRGAEAEASS